MWKRLLVLFQGKQNKNKCYYLPGFVWAERGCTACERIPGVAVTQTRHRLCQTEHPGAMPLHVVTRVHQGHHLASLPDLLPVWLHTDIRVLDVGKQGFSMSRHLIFCSYFDCVMITDGVKNQICHLKVRPIFGTYVLIASMSKFNFKWRPGLLGFFF